MVIYDSLYGNTKKVAAIIADTLEAKLLNVNDLSSFDVYSADLLIIGSPTQGGKPTETIQKLIDDIPKLNNIRVAAFDTRIKTKWVKIFGFAANRIARVLQEKGGKLVALPEGFLVDGKKGPLVENELERAKTWARELIE